MKSLLILILSVLLAGGAWLSKPSEESFRQLVRRKMAAEPKQDRTVIDVIFKKKDKTERFLSECRYKNRVLWATVEKDGKTIYTGVFSTWFPSNLKIEKVPGQQGT